MIEALSWITYISTGFLALSVIGETDKEGGFNEKNSNCHVGCIDADVKCY